MPHERREGDPARQPRLRLRRGDREARQVARARRSIDYDRLTLKGAASYYVSFDNVSVGKLQGQGLVNCLKASGAYQQEAGHRRAERLADRQQRDAVRAGLQLGPEPAVQERHAQEGPGPVGAGLGQPEGADDLRGHADRRRTTRSTASPRPTTASAARSISALEARTASSRSRSPARMRRRRVSSTSSPAGSA